MKTEDKGAGTAPAGSVVLDTLQGHGNSKRDTRDQGVAQRDGENTRAHEMSMSDSEDDKAIDKINDLSREERLQKRCAPRHLNERRGADADILLS